MKVEDTKRLGKPPPYCIFYTIYKDTEVVLEVRRCWIKDSTAISLTSYLWILKLYITRGPVLLVDFIDWLHFLLKVSVCLLMQYKSMQSCALTAPFNMYVYVCIDTGKKKTGLTLGVLRLYLN